MGTNKVDSEISQPSIAKKVKTKKFAIHVKKEKYRANTNNRSQRIAITNIGKMDSRYFSLLPRSAMQQTKKWTKRHSKYTFRRRCGNDQDDYRKIKQNNPRYKKV